jgi:hypothetical protein
MYTKKDKGEELGKSFKEFCDMSKGMRIYLVCLVWVAALVQLYINSKVDYEKNMVQEAIATETGELCQGSVTAYGYYGDVTMTEEKRNMIAEKLAAQLGVMEDYALSVRSTEDGELSVLEKTGEQADTKIKVISLNTGETYLHTQIDFKGTACSAAYEYKKLLAELYGDIGVDATTNLYLASQRKGQLDEDEIQIITDDFLESLDAGQVLEIGPEDGIAGTTLVYGYSRAIDEYVYQNDEKVNVNIAITYDETEDVTYIHRGVPFVDKSF